MKKGMKMLIAASLGVVAVAPTVVTTASAAEATVQDGIYVGGSVNKFYTVAEFVGFSPAKQVEILSATDLKNIHYVFQGKVASLSAMSTNGLNALQTYQPGVLNASYTGTNGTVTPPATPANGELSVESVSAINAKTVDITFTAPTKDVLGATVEVKDAAGTVYKVKPVDISAGDKSASFDFVTAVDAKALTGVWTVDGKEYSFTAIGQLKAITDAASASPVNQVKLLDALTKAGIKSVDQDSLATYAAAIVDASPESLADVQKAIDDTNKTATDSTTKANAVKAVADATNQVQLLKALQANFDRVNADWITNYAAASVDLATGNKVMLDLVEANYAGVAITGTTVDAIQAAIDSVNAINAGAAFDVAWNSVDSADLAKAKDLINTYVADDEDVAISDKDAALDSVAVLEAVIKVNDATTNNSLKAALVALDTLETSLVTKYKGSAHTVNNDFDITDVNDSLLASYRTAIGTAAKDDKNQRSDIQTIIDSVNATANARLVTGDFGVWDESGVTGYNVGLRLVGKTASEVKTVQVKLYKGENVLATATSKDLLTQYPTATLLSAPFDVIGDFDYVADASWTYSGWNGAVTDIPTKAEITVTFKDGAVITKTNTTPVSGDTSIFTDAVAQDLVDAINEATTATAVKAALDELAIGSYVDVSSADKLYIAEQVLEVRDTITTSDYVLNADGTNSVIQVTTAKTFASVTDLTGHLDGIIAEYTDLLVDYNYYNLGATSNTVSLLGALDYAPFEALTAGQKSNVAEAFIAKYPADKYGNAVNYKTLSAVKAGIDAAITAVNNGEVLPTPPAS